MEMLCEFPMLPCGSHAQAFGQVFVPRPKVTCDDKMIEDALGKHVGKFFLAITLLGECMVETQCLSVLAIGEGDGRLCEIRQKCPPAALDGKRQMSVSCELQKDGETALYGEAGVGVLKDAEMPRLDDVFDGGIGGFLLVALRCGGLDER